MLHDHSSSIPFAGKTQGDFEESTPKEDDRPEEDHLAPENCPDTFEIPLACEDEAEGAEEVWTPEEQLSRRLMIIGDTARNLMISADALAYDPYNEEFREHFLLLLRSFVSIWRCFCNPDIAEAVLAEIPPKR